MEEERPGAGTSGSRAWPVDEARSRAAASSGAARLHAEPGAAAETPAARCVEVAVDVAGAAAERTYTYRVPAALADLAAGEAVLVEFGRRQALGVVLGGASPPADVAPKPVLARVRSDGPLLPLLQLQLVRAVARRYLAPPALVARAALPPGLLERLELVAVGAPEAARGARAAGGRSGGLADDSDSASRRALEAVCARVAAAGPGGVPVRSLPWSGGRAALLRELRLIEAAGGLRLEWRISAPSFAPRVERRVGLTPAGREVVRTLGAAASGPRRSPTRLGPRQRAVLVALAALPDGETVPAAPLAESHGAGALVSLARRGLLELTIAEHPRRPLAGRAPGLRGAAPVDARLSAAQRDAVAAIVAAIVARRPGAFLLDGVTGAGRTAVYAAAIEAALAAGRSALVLVPEIALAVPLVDRLRAELGVEVALLHGGLSEGERADEWRRIRDGAVAVVVGTRSAVFAPLADPGVVIVDEEHDAAYKSDRTPRYQARDVALELGSFAAAPVVLGSATPDVATLGRARAGEFARVALPERPAGTLPEVEVVDLRVELAAGNRGLLSRPLVAALAALDRGAGERAILVINRRGAASVVLCRDCGYVQVCPECRRPLVYHAAAAALRCHHCGASAPLASRCPACGSARIRYLGGGTERLEREVRTRFPGYRVGRLDRDVLAPRGAAQRLLDALRDGRLDVLVGTGMVAKGIDVPEVTLVGVVSADIALNLPDLRAAERTYQLLAQAVGRAGRGDRPGRAIVQTYRPEHPAIAAVRTGDPAAFYDAELAERRVFGLPPYGRLVKLTVALADREAAEAEAERMAGLLRARAAQVAAAAPAVVLAAPAPLAGGAAHGPSAPPATEELGPSSPPRPSSGPPPPVEVLGPVPAYVARRAGRWRVHVVLRGADPLRVLERDPGPPWSVDVDPESLL